MDTNTVAAAREGAPQAPRLGFLQRLVGIYFEPKKTFEDLERKRSWVGMFLIVAVLVTGANFALVLRIDPETMLRKGIERNPFTKKMSEEQKDQIVARSKGSFQRYSQVIFAPVAVLVVYLVAAGVLLLVFVLMGASLTFKSSLAVTVWGLGAPAAIHLLLASVLVLVKDPDTIDVFNVVNNVASDPSIAVDEREHAVLHSLLDSLDVFSLWAVYLLATGFSTISRGLVTPRKAAGAVLIPWALYVAGKAGLAAVFS